MERNGNQEGLHQAINQLDDALSKLCYEGKVQFGRNLNEVQGVLGRLEGDLDQLMNYEENFLFPFLVTHIPRLEPLITLLISEHEDFRKILESLKQSLRRLSRQDEGGRIDRTKIKEEGAYLICLLRSHLWVENDKIYRAAHEELKAAERVKLGRIKS